MKPTEESSQALCIGWNGQLEFRKSTMEDMRGEYKLHEITQKKEQRFFTCCKSQQNSTEDLTVHIPAMTVIYFKL